MPFYKELLGSLAAIFAFSAIIILIERLKG